MSLTESAASRESIARIREGLDEQVRRNDAGELSSMAAQLYAVADLLEGQPRLRRTLGDPASGADARAQLAHRLFNGRVGGPALVLVEQAARLRWSRPWDLVDALEDVADEALLASAERSDGGRSLDEVEDELFRFERILAVQSELTSLLDEQSVPAERRVALLREVLGRKVQPITEQLLEHAVSSGRKRSVELAIDDLLDASARRRARSVARVLTAVPLSDEQERRLTSVLSEIYGRPITVRSAVDPTVLGGLVIRVGDELIDGSIATRFVNARDRLAG